MKLTHPLKLIRNGLIALSLMLGVTTVHAVPTIDASQAGENIETLARYAEEMKKWGEQLQNWQTSFQNWQKTFTQATAGNFSSLTSSLGLGDGTLSKTDNRDAYTKFINDFQKNKRCDRMSEKQQVAKSLCNARLNIEVAKFKKLAEMLDYTDQKNDEIKAALKKANGIDGANNATEKMAALSQVQTLQNNLKDGVKKYTDEMSGYDAQINILKTQQAEVARTVLQGKPPGLLEGVASAALMKGAFEAIKH